MNTENAPEYLTIAVAKPDEFFSEGKLTSVGVINEFFNAINVCNVCNVCNVIKLNEQHSPNYFENNDLITGYTEFSPQNSLTVKLSY